MIEAFKDRLKSHWPSLRLRSILLAVLLFAAAMPAIEAIWLRGYENTLVQQTEAELVAESKALTAAVAALWPGFQPPNDGLGPRDAGYYRPDRNLIDLNTAVVLSERPAARPAALAADPDAITAAQRVEPILDGAARSALASIVLLDRRGRALRGAQAGGDLSALPEVRQALQGRAMTVLRRNGDYHPRHSLEWLSRASALRVHHAHPIVVNGQVVGVLLLSRSPRALFRGAYEDLWKIALGAVVIIGLLIGLSGLVSRGVTRPIEALSAATQAVAAGRGLVPETPPTAAIEIRALYEDFRSMAEVMNKRSRYLRDFAAAVSHEFKTPLAGIGGAVELLQDHFETMSGDERSRFLANIGDDNARLSQLVARLLDLARADMATPEAGAVGDIKAATRRIADARSGADFRIVLHLPGRLAPVAVPEAVIEAVVTTLADNSRLAKARTVQISARLKDEAVVLTVEDDGPGVPDGDRDRLFELFFTTRRAEGGTGLGLPIARSLMEAHGGGLHIVEAAQGAVFEIILPIAAIGGTHGLH